MTSHSNENTLYPGQLDGYLTMPLLKDGVDEIIAADHNRLRNAIVSIETTLGVGAGGTSSVATRLDTVGGAANAIAQHIANPTGAHQASAISFDDPNSYFAVPNTQDAISELALMLRRPNYIGENIAHIPNSGIPYFVDGYGTKFIYNTGDFSGEALDNEVARTQTRKNNGISGIHIFELSPLTPNGNGSLLYTTGNLQWRAPGDSFYGAPVDISNAAPATKGTQKILYSYDTTKVLRFAYDGNLPPSGSRTENFEIYELDAVDGYFSATSDYNPFGSGGMQHSNFITHLSTSRTGTSHNQCMLSGIIYPADRGTLVLQRSIAHSTTPAYFPIAVLELNPVFTESLRTTEQLVSVPSLTLLDTITLFDRLPLSQYFTNKRADGSIAYEDWPFDYPSYQMARYLIPISNSGNDPVADLLSSPTDISNTEFKKVTAYRIVHFRPGVDYTISEPTQEQIYSIHSGNTNEMLGPDSNVNFTNFYLDPGTVLPEVANLVLRPVSTTENVTKMLSGIHYYNGASDTFDVELTSNTSLFANTYVQRSILHFDTNAFSFVGGYNISTGGYYGTDVDLFELMDSGNVLFSQSNLPDIADSAQYLINGTHNTSRRLTPSSNMFSAKPYITATLYDTFGSGDGYTSSGAYVLGSVRDQLLINTYATRSTLTAEYFTDETNRITGLTTFGDAYMGAWSLSNPAIGATYLTSVAYNNADLWMAVGYSGSSGIIQISYDGYTWANVIPYNGVGKFYSVAYGAGQWIAVGTNALSASAVIQTSNDGYTWITRAPASGSQILYDVSYGNGLWVAVGTNGTQATVQTSYDGISWTAQTIGFPAFSGAFYAVSYGNGRWTAVGTNNTFNAGIIRTSDDNGVTWTLRAPTAGVGAFNGVYYNGTDLWVAVGTNTSFNSAIIQASADGTSWGSKITASGAASLNAVSYGAGLWVADGYDGTTTAKIQTSPDGTNWSNQTAPVTVASLLGVAYNGYNLWVSVGRSSAPIGKIIKNSLSLYSFNSWNSNVPIESTGLQCGARFVSDGYNTCGLIYPQNNYGTNNILPLQTGIPAYDGYTGDKVYQRLFGLGYPVQNARLHIVSSESYPFTLSDISYGNANRFGKIEVKIPGIDSNSTGWLDIGRLFQNNIYTDGYGAQSGMSTGSAGDFIVPFTFGTRNNANVNNMIAVRVTYFGSTSGQRTAAKQRIITMLELLPPE